MTRILLIVTCFVMSLIGRSQILPIAYDTLTYKQEFIAFGSGENSASAITNEVMYRFMYGGFITSEMKGNSLANHTAINRVGIELNGELEYRNYGMHLFPKKDWGLQIKGGASAIGGLLYPKDLFGLMLFGNQKYLGDTMDLSGANFRFMAFEKVGIGCIDPISKSSVSLNFYNIRSRAYASFRSAELIQSADGGVIEMDVSGTVELQNNRRFNQGFGAGIDIDLKMPFVWKDERTSFVQIKVSNLGLAYLHEKQKVYAIDTNIVFDGFRFDELVDNQNIKADSVTIFDSLGIKSQLRNRMVWLLGYIQVGKIIDDMDDKRLQSFFGLRLYPTMLYSPMLFAGLHFNTTKSINMGANISYGGYAHFKGGFYLQYRAKRFVGSLGTENLSGWLNKNGNGHSVLLRVRCVI